MRAHRGPTILVLGIMSLVICGFFGPVVWVMANRDLAEMDGGTLEPEGRSLTKAGKVLGMIGTVLGFLQLAWLVFFLVMTLFSLDQAQGSAALILPSR